MGDAGQRQPAPRPAPDRLERLLGDQPRRPDRDGGQRGRTLRGYFDYEGQQAGIDSTTDGTSNTILIGEVLPYQMADMSFWDTTGQQAGTTVPINFNSNRIRAGTANCPPTFGGGTFGCRFHYAYKGFKSEHPGGANFVYADGSVHFLKQTINLATYSALGSRNGGEVISADSY